MAPPVFLTAEGVRQLGSLMDGIEHDFLGMVRTCLQEPLHMLSSRPASAQFPQVCPNSSRLVTAPEGPEAACRSLTSFEASRFMIPPVSIAAADVKRYCCCCAASRWTWLQSNTSCYLYP